MLINPKTRYPQTLALSIWFLPQHAACMVNYNLRVPALLNVYLFQISELFENVGELSLRGRQRQ
jgi:hypothetical protein